MFDIEYKGGNTVVISTKSASLVTDPKQTLIGLKEYKLKDKIQLATESRFVVDNSDAVLTIDGPGEYEVADFSIKGMPTQRHLDPSDVPFATTTYRIEIGDVRIALLGNTVETLSESQIEEIGIVDIVIIPVGGNGYTLDATGASKLLRKLEPKVAIPVHYADSGLSYEVPQDELDVFLKELGGDVAEETTKYKLKSSSALPASLTVVPIARS